MNVTGEQNMTAPPSPGFAKNTIFPPLFLFPCVAPRFIFLNPSPHNSRDERCGKWIFGREMESCGGSPIGTKFAAECIQDLFTHPVETQVVFECSKEDKGSVMGERRHPVTDAFFCHGSSSPDGPAKL